MLPMTTRKKLSHLRAQIKRQATKAARSRLEKRSSGSSERGANLGLGVSLDEGSDLKHQASEGYSGHHHHHHHRQLDHQPNSSSSTESPNASTSATNTNTNNNNSNQSTSSPAAGQSASHSHLQQASAGGSSSTTNPNQSPGQHNESGGGANLTVPGGSGGHHRLSSKELGVSVHQKNFKQKLIALLKKFRTDGSDFDSEEQYREALERELMKAAAGRGSRAIEELLEEDIDVEEESGSELEDWDNISELSTPKPSLRPFFSSTTLDKI